MRMASVVLVEVARAGEAIAEIRHGPGRARPEVSHGVPVAAVPLRPQHGKVPDLIAAVAEVPRLRDQLHVRENRVLVDDVEEGAHLVDGAGLARERRREVEAEAVDVHLGDPVAEAVHHELERLRVQHVQAVSAAGEVVVERAVFGAQAVVRRVVEATQADRRSELISLAGVVVDDVEHDLEAGPVERLHHRLELGDLRAGHRGEAVAGCEERERGVAPVVLHAARSDAPLIHVLLDGEELDRRDSQALEVLDDGRVREAEIGPAKVLRHRRMGHRHTLHVHLVEHRVRPRHVRMTVAFPVESHVAHDRLRYASGTVTEVRRPVIRRLAGPSEPLHRRAHVAKDGLAVVNRALERERVRIDEQLVRVEPHPRLRRIHAVRAEAVPLSGAKPGDEPVPDVRAPIAERNARLDASLVEKTDIHARRVLGEDGEVHALTALGVERRAERRVPPRPRC